MKQVVQSVRGGELRVVEAPRPTIGPTDVLVEVTHSLVSAGTERAVRELASASLLGKARARPDLVRQVINRARDEGIRSTLKAVQTRLDEEMPLGYSAAGTVLAVGGAVDRVRPGDRVATGGQGHAEYQAVAAPLAVPVPDGVTNRDAAFATVAAIALHGLRLAELGPGSRVCVVGLGLLGQLTVRLAQAAGYEVAGIDVRAWNVERAVGSGAMALVESGDDATAAIVDWSRGRGVDAVLLTAATKASDAARRSPALCRDRAPVVVVGDVGLELDRTPFYEKELSVRFARSYGPGRYERSYEEWGVDYPPGFVRWTEGRNLEAFLDLVAAGRVRVDDLVTHTFAIDDAKAAYDLLASGREPFLGVQLEYPARPGRDTDVVDVSPKRAGGSSIGLLGAGNFARMTLVPALDQAGFDRRAFVASASGLSARQLAERAGFERATSNADVVIASPDVDAVVIATPHDTHAELAVKALEAGKHVFCEKPLALTDDELRRVADAWRASGGQLMVGFNRRHSAMVRRVRDVFAPAGGPLVLTYRVSAGRLSDTHWYKDRRQGGRLLGEVCHFVDTCNAVVGTGVPVEWVACAGSSRGEALVDEDVSLLLSYADGSSAAITYGSGGHASTPKERFEVLGRGHSASIDDYRALVIDGQPAKDVAGGKGHAAGLAAFKDAITSGQREAAFTEPSLHTMAVTLAAVESLLNGTAVRPRPV